jgi:hypothetical protein
MTPLQADIVTFAALALVAAGLVTCERLVGPAIRNAQAGLQAAAGAFEGTPLPPQLPLQFNAPSLVPGLGEGTRI